MPDIIFSRFGRHRQTAEQFFRFGLVGTVNTGLDFGVYVALTRGFDFWRAHFLAANAIAFACGVVSSFLLNNFWTFRKDGRGLLQKSAKFLIVCAGALVWNSLILYALTAAGFHDLVAKMIATLAVALWNFTMYKFWAFGG